MQTRILSVLIAMVATGSACAQDVPPPPPGYAPAYAALAGALPPLPPGCLTYAPPPPQPPVWGIASDVVIQTALGVSSAQAAQVRQVFERRDAQRVRIDGERRELDAGTCQSLRRIVGDQGLMRWWSVAPGGGPGGWAPPPPAPGVAPPPPPVPYGMAPPPPPGG